MPISNRLKEVIKTAVDTEDYDLIISELNAPVRGLPKKYNTILIQKYGVIKELKKYSNKPFVLEWIKIIKPVGGELDIYKESRKEVKKNEKNIDTDIFEYIIKNKDLGILNKFLYVLINTGCRTSEIHSAPYEVKNNKLFIQLNKKKIPELYHIQLLDNNLQQTIKYIEEIRKEDLNINSLSELLKRKLKPYNITAHGLRALYCELMKRFKKKDNRGHGQYIKDVLNHSRCNNDHYDYIKLTGELDTNPFNNNLDKKTVKELRHIAKNRGLVGYSKLNKNDLLQLLKS